MDKWKYFYPDAQEIMPRHMQEALSNYVVIKAYVYFNHAINMANRRLHYGIIVYANNVLIIWCSKLQNTVETLSLGSEFVALSVNADMVEALR